MFVQACGGIEKTREKVAPARGIRKPGLRRRNSMKRSSLRPGSSLLRMAFRVGHYGRLELQCHERGVAVVANRLLQIVSADRPNHSSGYRKDSAVDYLMSITIRFHSSQLFGRHVPQVCSIHGSPDSKRHDTTASSSHQIYKTDTRFWAVSVSVSKRIITTIQSMVARVETILYANMPCSLLTLTITGSRP